MRNLFSTLFLALGLYGCASPKFVPQPPQPYTRIANPDSNTVALQIALRKFVPVSRRGPSIWLASTMHLGEPQYYASLQKFLDAQTVVLFEGINTDAHPRHVNDTAPAPKSEEPSETNASYSLQATLAKSLGLVFQLDAINYDRTNFLNSDLSVAQIQHILEGNAPPGAVPTSPPNTTAETNSANPSFDALLQVMDGSSFLGSLVKIGVQFIGASPKLQAVTKLTLIEAVGRLKGDLSDLRQAPPDLKQLIQVLIHARNQNVIHDLETELKRVPKKGSIAIFYGTGHMDDLERRLESDLNYRPASDVWLTAFSVDMQKSGISSGEAEMMRNLVKWQLDQMMK